MTGCDGEGVELGGVGVLEPSTSRANSMTAHCMPRHSPRYGTALCAGEARGGDLALDAAMAEAAGHDDAVDARRAPTTTSPSSSSASTQLMLHLDAVVHAGVAERLDDADVGVGHARRTCPPPPIAHGRPGSVMRADQLAPAGRDRARRAADVEPLDDEVAQPGLLEQQRHLVDRAHVGHGDHRPASRRRRRARSCPSAPASIGLLAARHDDVGLDADAAQLVDAVLGWLGLELLGRRRCTGTRVRWT